MSFRGTLRVLDAANTFPSVQGSTEKPYWRSIAIITQAEATLASVCRKLSEAHYDFCLWPDDAEAEVSASNLVDRLYLEDVSCLIFVARLCDGRFQIRLTGVSGVRLFDNADQFRRWLWLCARRMARKSKRLGQSWSSLWHELCPELLRHASSTSNIPEVRISDVLLRFAGPVLPCEYLSAWWECSDGVYRRAGLWASEFLRDPYREKTTLRRDEIPWLLSMRDSSPTLASAVQSWPQSASREKKRLIGAGLSQFALLPLYSEGNGGGFLQAGSRGGELLKGDSIRALRTLASVIALQREFRELSSQRAQLSSSYRRIFDILDQGILVFDPRARAELVNARFSELTGFSEAQLKGRDAQSIAQSLGLEAASLLSSERDQEFAGVRAAQVPQLGTVTEDRRWLELQTNVLTNQLGQEQGSVALFTDVSKRKNIEAQLAQSQKMEALGQLAGGLAHDFNNLLTAVLGYSGILLRRLSVEDPHRRELLQIRRASERAGRLVSQLLTFGRKATLRPELVEVNRLLEETVDLLRRLIGENIHLELSLSSVPIFAMVDAGQLQQILLNLAINARDAMPEGGVLSIRSELQAELGGQSVEMPRNDRALYVCLRIRDTGSGIAPEHLQRIFEPFFTTKASGRGTGLGLSTVYGIVHQNGGQIDVRSELGRGTEFSVYLPAAEASLQDTEAGGLLPVPKGRETILLVEDDRVVRPLITEILQRAGYSLLVAGDGREAERISKNYRGQIDAIVTDVVMPFRDGCSSAEAICALRPETRVLLISGYPSSENLRQFLSKPARVFLPKPFVPSQLCQVLRDLLDLKLQQYPQYSALQASAGSD